MIRGTSIVMCALATLFAATNSFAVDGSSPAKSAFVCKAKLSSSDLQGTLNRVQQSYQKLNSVSARFDQDSYLAALDTSETSSGTVLFSKPGRMRWDYEDPEPQQFVLRDHTVWLYQPEIKQVVIDELSQVLLTDLPVSFLMGVGNLNDGFSLKGGCKSEAGTVLTLEPRKADKKSDNSLKTFKLLVSPENFPAGAQVLDVVGNTTTIALSAVKENEPIEDSKFTATYPPGTDINDRRVEKRG